MDRYLKQAGILLFGFALSILSPAHAASRNDCNDALDAVEVQRIDFGDISPNGGGTVTVTPSGTRSTTGPLLFGSSFNRGVISVKVTLADCHCYPLRIQRPDRNAVLESGANSMPLSRVITNPTSADDITLTTDVEQLVYVGAELDVLATQAAGTYNTVADTYSVRFRFRRSPTSGNQCP